MPCVHRNGPSPPRGNWLNRAAGAVFLMSGCDSNSNDSVARSMADAFGHGACASTITCLGSNRATNVMQSCSGAALVRRSFLPPEPTALATWTVRRVGAVASTRPPRPSILGRAGPGLLQGNNVSHCHNFQVYLYCESECVR